MNNKALCRKLEIEQHEIGCPGRGAVPGIFKYTGKLCLKLNIIISKFYVRKKQISQNGTKIYEQFKTLIDNRPD
jgi:hypothetical protein